MGLVLISCSVAVGCSTSAKNSTGDTADTDRFIARNLAGVFVQLISPEDAVINIKRSALAQHVRYYLMESGYAVRLVSEVPENSNGIIVVERTHQGRHAYVLRYKDISLKRRYTHHAPLYPVSPVYVSGAGSAIVALRDDFISASDQPGYVSAVVMNPPSVSD